MPLVHRQVSPVRLSSSKLSLSGKADCEFYAVNNSTLVNALHQLSSLVAHAGDIFSGISQLASGVGLRISSIKLRLDELEAKVELYDPKLVPVPEGSLDDDEAAPISHTFRPPALGALDSALFLKSSRPPFLLALYERTGAQRAPFPDRSPVLLPKNTKSRAANSNSLERNGGSRRPASIAALRDWKLDDYVDEKLATLDRKKKPGRDELATTVSGSFGPAQLVQVNVTGFGFDRMKLSRRSLSIHTKRIRSKKKRRNTICGGGGASGLPNKECGIQTSFSSVLAAAAADGGAASDGGGHARARNKYARGIDSGHWSSCTTSGVGGGASCSTTTSAPSPWAQNSNSDDVTTSCGGSDFMYDDDEDRTLTPQLENFTDGLVSDSDCSVDSAGFFTSFRNDCGFPKYRKAVKGKEEEDGTAAAGGVSSPSASTVGGCVAPENEYELFGKGSTSTTASSCGTVVLRRTATTTRPEDDEKRGDARDADFGWEERVKRKSLIELVPSLVVVTPSPSCSLSGASPPPLNDPSPRPRLHEPLAHSGIPYADEDEDDFDDNGEESGSDDLERLTPTPTPNPAPLTPRGPHPHPHPGGRGVLTDSGSEGTLSDDDNEDLQDPEESPEGERDPTPTPTPTTSTKPPAPSGACAGPCLPKPDVIPPDAFQQMQIIRTTPVGPKLKSGTDYVSLDTVQGGLSNGHGNSAHSNSNSSSNGSLDDLEGGASGALRDPRAVSAGPNTSARLRGAKVVLDPNGEIIFSSETLKRKRRQKISFDPGSSVRSVEGAGGDPGGAGGISSSVRESIYDRLRPRPRPEKLDSEIYECIEKIRAHNLRESEAIERKYDALKTSVTAPTMTSSPSPAPSPSPSGSSQILETDLDSFVSPMPMPELETLPKIKDRLKRNESYRMANEELALRPSLSTRLSGTAYQNGTGADGKKRARSRDIPEEDPIFIREVLSASSSTNSLSRSSPSPSHLPFSGSLFGRRCSSSSGGASNQAPPPSSLGGGGHAPFSPHSPSGTGVGAGGSKFGALPSSSSDERPSFLKRDSSTPPSASSSATSPPPSMSMSMDSITKEIWRFRKKFNIQPNASSVSLLRPPPAPNITPLAPPPNPKPPAAPEDLYAQIQPKASRMLSEKNRRVAPSTPTRTCSPLFASTPINMRSTTVTSSRGPPPPPATRQPFFGRKQVYSTPVLAGAQDQRAGAIKAFAVALEKPPAHTAPPPLTPKSVTFAGSMGVSPGVAGGGEAARAVRGLKYSEIKSPPSMDPSGPSGARGSARPVGRPRGMGVGVRAGRPTSLNEFKKLLQATANKLNGGGRMALGGGEGSGRGAEGGCGGGDGAQGGRSPISAMEALKPRVGNSSSSSGSTSNSSINSSPNYNNSTSMSVNVETTL